MSARIFWQRARVFLGVLLALALVGLCAWLFVLNWRPSERTFPIQGIDVSAAHGAIDWRRVTATSSLSFAYVRATMGAAGRDRRFAFNWRESFKAGVPHGAIHVFSLCQLAADQAGNLARRVPSRREDLPVALELDFDPECAARPDRAVVLTEIARFLAGAEAHSGKRAVLKISRPFEERYRVSAAIRRPLWSVQAFSPPSYFDKPWTIWQASSFRRIEGVAGPVNWDVMAR
ncbi:MAG: GH25 family lysozyme [Sphingomonas sp.]